MSKMEITKCDGCGRTTEDMWAEHGWVEVAGTGYRLGRPGRAGQPDDLVGAAGPLLRPPPTASGPRSRKGPPRRRGWPRAT